MYPQTTTTSPQSSVAPPRSSGWPSGWVIGGIALVALGGLFWYSFGPDFRRYMKMKSM